MVAGEGEERRGYEEGENLEGGVVCGAEREEVIATTYGKSTSPLLPIWNAEHQGAYSTNKQTHANKNANYC